MKSAVIVLTSALVSACAVSPVTEHGLTDRNVLLTRADGAPVSVPISGPLSSDRLTSLSEEIIAATAGVDRLFKSSNPVDQQVAAIATELRDEAAGDIDLAIRIAKRTSGSVDAQLVRASEGKLALLKSLLKAPSPPSVIVTTDIRVVPADRMLHFVTMSTFKAGNPLWESYTSQSKMRIGRYMFRVLPCVPLKEGYLEPVLVLEEPTRRTLQPQCR